MDDLEEGMHGRFALSGRIDLRLEPDIDLSLTRIEARFRGSLDAIEEPFRLTLEGPVGELRKLAPKDPAIARILLAVGEESADASGTLTLEAKPEHARAMADAARGTPAGDPHAWLRNEPFMVLLLQLEQYGVVSVGTVLHREAE